MSIIGWVVFVGWMIYVVGFLAFARGTSFSVTTQTPQPGDRLKSALLWPLIVIWFAWLVWTKQATVRRVKGKS